MTKVCCDGPWGAGEGDKRAHVCPEAVDPPVTILGAASILRQFVCFLALLLVAAKMLLPLLAACSVYVGAALSVPVTDRDYASAPTVAVKNGTLSGIHSAEYEQDFFLGIPYAQQAVRFAQSQPLNTTWEDTKEATAYPPHCIGYGGDDIGYELSEDCLYLNVVKPAGLNDTSGLPVAVWIHGGGLYMGGSADRRYNLSFIVENSVNQGTPIVAVSFNYRLSAFGFLSGKEALEAGVTNIGFHDQRLALHWVNENIAAFGGSPDKVTIFGESSGAESVSAQVFAYNGRDDGLFRGAIAESGFGAVLPRYPGGLNATDYQQVTFDNLVRNTSCASTVGTPEAITCLRDAPFEEINTAINVTGVSPWPPVLDHDFIADYPANQIANEKFVHVPIIIGSNTDEGTAFGPGRGPNDGPVNTDSDFAYAVGNILSSNVTNSTGKSADEIIYELSILYPNIQSIGIPSLESWPVVITNETEEGEDVGLQYRRINALAGDYTFHYARRRASLAWSNADIPSYTYRFDVIVNGVPDYVAATHFQEVAFVFYNLNGDGYATNPFANTTQEYKDLALTISSAWINFFVSLDPNSAAVSPQWPIYNTTSGGGVGEEIVWSVVNEGSYVEFDDYRAEGIKYMSDNALTLFGN
ncbi:putative Alpha/Beta hydrolase protein [Seiridium cardinale]